MQGPPVGCHAPRCQPRPGPSPSPRGPHNGCLSLCQMLQLDSSLPSSPLRVSFPPRVPTSPTGVPQPPHPRGCQGVRPLASHQCTGGALSDPPSSFGGGGSEMPPMRQIGPQTPFPSTNTTLLRTHGCRGVPKRMQAHEGVPGARPRLCCPVPVPPLGPRHRLHQRPTEPRTGLGWKGHLGPANSSPKPASCSLPAPRISPLCLLCAPLLPQFAPFALPVRPLCSPSLLPLLSQFAPSLTSPTQLNFGGSDHHTKPHVPATGRAARAKYSVSPSCGHPRCHPNFHPGVVGSAKPPTGHFMGGKHHPTTRTPWCGGGDGA